MEEPDREQEEERKIGRREILSRRSGATVRTEHSDVSKGVERSPARSY